MNRTDLIERVQELGQLRSKADAQRAVEAALSAIQTGLRSGQRVELVGFGSFSVADTKARTGRNPMTGEPIEIAAGKRVAFKASKRLLG